MVVCVCECGAVFVEVSSTLTYRRAPKWKREEFLSSSDRERMESDVTVSGDSVYVKYRVE